MEPSETPTSPVDQIREILFPSELDQIQAQLSELDKKLNKLESLEHSVESLSKVLPDTIKHSSQAHPQPMAQAFAPIVGQAITTQIRDEKEKIVDALYPVIGSTITKYMAQALRDLKESVNRRIESKVSVGSFIRRMKAQLFSVSEADLVIEQSLRSEFQNLFLIHKNSGLLIAETHQETAEAKDGDMIAGMMTAISSFIEDWISGQGQNFNLDSIDYGQYTIFFEQSSRYLLAGVVKGAAPDSLRKPLQDLLASLLTKFAGPLKNFSGLSGPLPRGVIDKIQKAIDIPRFQRRIQKRKQRNSRIIYGILLVFSVFLSWRLVTSSWDRYLAGQIQQKISGDALLRSFPIDIKYKRGLFTARGWVTHQGIKDRLRGVVNEIVGTKSSQFDFSQLKDLSAALGQVSLPSQRRVDHFFKKIQDSSAPGLSWSFSKPNRLRLGGLLTQAQATRVSAQWSDTGWPLDLDLQWFVWSSEGPWISVDFSLGEVELSRQSQQQLREALVRWIQDGAVESGAIDVLYLSDASGSEALNRRLFTRRKVVINSFLNQAFSEIRAQNPGDKSQKNSEVNIRWQSVSEQQRGRWRIFEDFAAPTVVLWPRERRHAPSL